MIKKLILFFALFFLFNSSIFAQDSSSRYKEISDQIRELEQKLAETQAREKTLSSQISYMNNQIKLTTLKISETQAKIDQLGEEIASLSAKIDRLEESLGHLSEVLLSRIVETYKRGNVEFFHLLFSSGGFSDFLTRLKYIRIVQAHDKKLMFQMQETKDNYTDQKQVREEKKAEHERLKRQLEGQKAMLAQQIKDKETLLEVTRNDEKRYQELLAFLKNISVTYDDDKVGRMNFTGDWNWPISDPRITQEYVMSYWARLGWYNGGPHTGIDMTSPNNIIKAPKKGTLYKGNASCRGVGMNFVAIDHGDGLISWYWHVQ
ncbi:hypothetical protein HZB97_01440 [Candidatus Gottesmanbacteria bacterium]|nr:hypothetical protein [Candidatus Gottesmanbacteria bacterium]